MDVRRVLGTSRRGRQDRGGNRKSEEMPEIDLDVVDRLYWGEGKTTYEIADLLDTHQPLISRAMRASGLMTRSSLDSLRISRLTASNQIMRDVVGSEFRPTGRKINGEVYGIDVDLLDCGHAVKQNFKTYIDEYGVPQKRSAPAKVRTCTSCTNIANQKGQDLP